MSHVHYLLLLCDIIVRSMSADIGNTVPVLLAVCVLRAFSSSGWKLFCLIMWEFCLVELGRGGWKVCGNFKFSLLLL
jgi:hypothetical protein